ncbi:MAG: hypothetical protein JWO59_784 [Chloroflexi bacterium]|nr:hypothetical protein [Chloroflexota bacterium]
MFATNTLTTTTAINTGRQRTPYRRSRFRTIARRSAKTLGVIFALLGICLAIPPSRGFIIDQIIYQGDFFFPIHQRTVVVRDVHVRPGGPVEPVLVPVQSGTILGGQFASRALHGELRKYRIYLPPGYDSPQNRQRRYPVLYLIHGSPGNPGSWIRGAHADFIANEAIAAGTAPPMVMVMPDVNGGQWRDTECINKWNGSDNEMTYIIHDLIPYIDAHYRTQPAANQRAIGGLSSGGYCAFNLGLRNPGVFGTLFSISGYYHAIPSEVFGLNDPFGHNKKVIAANSPDLYVNHVPGMRKMHLIIADSTADWGYTGYAQRFDRQLTRLHIPHTLIMRSPTGFHLWDHSWAFWHSMFKQILPVVGASFGH